MFSKAKVLSELLYVDINFEFSDECSIELRNYILGNNLAYYYDDVLMLTPSGETLIGLDDGEDYDDRYDNPYYGQSSFSDDMDND